MNKEEIIEKATKEVLEAETNNYDLLNQIQTKRRVDWIRENKHLINSKVSDVRKAYEILLFSYMGIKPEEVPVVYEDEKKIIWRSYNWCPIMAVCKQLKLDTREVCKKGWEQSVQKMIEEINPKLRFGRNYPCLRPHGEYCEEFIELLDG